MSEHLHIMITVYRMKDKKRYQILFQLFLTSLKALKGNAGSSQIVIEGFTDTDGEYLYDLDLSLKRSEWVMCSLIDPYIGKYALTPEQRAMVKRIVSCWRCIIQQCKGKQGG